MLRQNLDGVIEEFEDALRRGGVHEALRLLNDRTPHRFTGVYRFDPPTLRNLHLFDRTNPDLVVGADAMMRETYCSIVGDLGAPFSTADALEDERLVDHPARETTISYCGVLLRSADGSPFGSLCHFDLRPNPIPNEEIPVLESVAPALMAALGLSDRE